MKRLVTVFGMLMILLAVCLSGCSEQNNVVITDCESGEVVAAFSSKEHVSEAASLTDALNNTEEVSAEVDYSQMYLVHFIDPKDSLYDIRYYAYLNTDSNEVYVKFDTLKMSEKYDGFVDDKMQKCTKLTANEFSAIISAKY